MNRENRTQGNAFHSVFNRGEELTLRVFRPQSRVAGSARTSSELSPCIMEAENKVAPTGTGKNRVGAGSVAFHSPANPEKRRQSPAGFTGWPLRHVARKGIGNRGFAPHG